MTEVLVVGDGPAGASLAFRLALKGVKVCVVGNSRPTGPAGQTLPPQGRRAAIELGLPWDETRIGLASYGIDASWGGGQHFHSHVVDADGNGLHIDRQAFSSWLLETTLLHGVQTLSSSSVASLSRTKQGWTVRLQRSERRDSIDCRFVVDATGRSAAVARRLGFRHRRFDRLFGVSAVLGRSTQLQTLSVEATEYGWWYSAPFSRDRAIVCLMSDFDVVRSIGANNCNRWRALLADTQLVRNLNAQSVDGLSTLPCETALLSRTSGDGWMAIGDAASVLDPLASAGIVKAFHDARTAADAIVAFLSRGEDLLLHEYSRRVSSEFTRYLSGRSAQYQLERRWQSAPFWNRRTH